MPAQHKLEKHYITNQVINLMYLFSPFHHSTICILYIWNCLTAWQLPTRTFCFGLLLACHQDIFGAETAGTHKYFKMSKWCVFFIRNLLACVVLTLGFLCQPLLVQYMYTQHCIRSSHLKLGLVLGLCGYNFNYHLDDFCAKSEWMLEDKLEHLVGTKARDEGCFLLCPYMCVYSMYFFLCTLHYSPTKATHWQCAQFPSKPHCAGFFIYCHQYCLYAAYYSLGKECYWA